MIANTNIIQNIEDRLTENKTSVKTYNLYVSAVKKAEELAIQFEAWNQTDVGVQYVVVMLPKTQRWTVIFDLSNWIARSKTGTYIGWFAQKGFFSI